MTEQAQPSDAETSEATTGSWEAVAPADAPTPEPPGPEPAAVEAPAPVDTPAPLEPPTAVEPAVPSDDAPEVSEPQPMATGIVEPSVDVPPPPAPAATSADRPEIVIGGAFAGGLVAALLLKRLAR